MTTKPIAEDRRSRSPGDTLRVGVLSSARAPGLERLLERGRAADAPYRVVAVMASDPAGEALDVARRAGVPCVARDLRAFRERAGEGLPERETRALYDRGTVAYFRRVGTDVVVMCGYLFIATDVLLDAFPGRVLNIHDADLTLTDGEGIPLYRGLHSTRDAVAAGEPETRSTVHLATAEVDEGPPLVRSRPFPVHRMVEPARRWEAEDLLKAYAYAQREWMMRDCWGALLDRALELVAAGRVRVVGDRAIVDGAFGPEDLDERAVCQRADRQPVRRATAAATDPGGPGRGGADDADASAGRRGALEAGA